MPLTQRNLGMGLFTESQLFGSGLRKRRGRVPEWLQIVIDTHPEYRETIECQAYTEVVDDADIEVSRVRAQVALVVLACRLQDDDG